jgi:acetolactate synthase-1/3 small subunit
LTFRAANAIADAPFSCDITGTRTKQHVPLNIEKGSSSHSAYDLRSHMSEEIETHTLAILVQNEAGVLARVIGLFSGRGYNIESLTVAEVDHEGGRSRITIVTSGTPQVINQIKMQLERMVPVHEVADLTVEGAFVSRELALIKVVARGEHRVEALRIAEIFRANVVDSRLKASSSRSPARPRRSTPSRN